MSQGRYINTGGGNYNESIQGNYIETNYIKSSLHSSINLNQPAEEVAIQIQALSAQLKAEGRDPAKIDQEIANVLVAEVRKQPSLGAKLIELLKYFGSSAAGGLIGEGAVRLALQFLGIPS